MTNIIYKYPLDRAKIDEIQTIEMPKNSLPLQAEFQNNQLVLWAWIFKIEKVGVERHHFSVQLTGKPFDTGDLKTGHVNTVTCPATGLVYHIFKHGHD